MPDFKNEITINGVPLNNTIAKSLNDLTDVIADEPNTNHILQWDGDYWTDIHPMFVLTDAIADSASVDSLTYSDLIPILSADWGFMLRNVSIQQLLDNAFVGRFETQTITGVKTWSNNAIFNGNVGIGISDMEAKLHVLGDARIDGNLQVNNSGSGVNLTVYRTVGEPNIKSSENYLIMDSLGTGSGVAALNWYVSDNVVLANGGGYVGIGMNTSPTSILDIRGGIQHTRVNIETTAAARAYIEYRNLHGLAITGLVGAANHLLTYSNNEDYIIGLRTGGTIRISADTGYSAERGFNLDEQGNVALGTRHIQAFNTNYRNIHLGIRANIMYSIAGVGGLYLMDNQYYDGAWKGRSAGDSSRVELASGGIIFSVNPSVTAGVAFSTNVVMSILKNGNVLIGKTTDSGAAYKLQVNSQIWATSATIATSDQRAKQDIELLTDGLLMINRLRPVTFEFKEHEEINFPKGRQLGFITQDIEKEFFDQEYVHSIVPKTDNDKQFKGMADTKLIPLLVKAVQELSSKVTELERRN